MNTYRSIFTTIFLIFCTNLVTAQSTQAVNRRYLDLPFAELVYVPGGTFQMGDTRNEGIKSSEQPVHTVTISSFLMGKYEVTQQQWKAIMGENPSYFSDCQECPVERVSWEDIQLFLLKVSSLTGQFYRLPTEAEWEYAAGGGSSNRTRFGNGQDIISPTVANYSAYTVAKATATDVITRIKTTVPMAPYEVAGENPGKTVKVGSYTPNRLGLHDMSGNVSEWCLDMHGSYSSEPQTNPIAPKNGSSFNIRGGNWRSGAFDCRVTYRLWFEHPQKRDFRLGFRIVTKAP